jgi:hypothetical protein
LILLIAGVAMTIIGWAVFTVAIVVLTVDPGADTSRSIVSIILITFGALVGSIGPFLVIGGALWWSLRVRERNRSGATWPTSGYGRPGPGGFGGGINVSG